MAHQARLQNLFKRRVSKWNDLVLDQRWKLNHRNLADIQSRWLDVQAARK